MTTAEEIEFVDAMTADELRQALMFLAGYSPDGFAEAIAKVQRDRAWRAETS